MAFQIIPVVRKLADKLLCSSTGLGLILHWLRDAGVYTPATITIIRVKQN